MRISRGILPRLSLDFLTSLRGLDSAKETPRYSPAFLMGFFLLGGRREFWSAREDMVVSWPMRGARSG